MVFHLVRGSRPGTSSALSVQIHRGHAQSHKAREQRLLHVGIFLEGHILNDRRKLVMITNHDPALQPTVAILRILVQKEKKKQKNLTMKTFGLHDTTFNTFGLHCSRDYTYSHTIPLY